MIGSRTIAAIAASGATSSDDPARDGRLRGQLPPVPAGAQEHRHRRGELHLYAAGFSFAYITLPAATGALLLFGAVQATMIGYGLWRGERLRAWQVAGLVVAFAGLAGLLLPGVSAPPVLGAALMLFAGFSWGIYSLRGRSAGDATRVTAGNFLRAVPSAARFSAELRWSSWPGNRHQDPDSVFRPGRSRIYCEMAHSTSLRGRRMDLLPHSQPSILLLRFACRPGTNRNADATSGITASTLKVSMPSNPMKRAITLKPPKTTSAKAIDPDNPSWREEMLGLPVSRRGRGPQRFPTKVSTTVRVDAEVLAYFRATGPGYQTRMNEALRRAMKRKLFRP